MVGQMNTSHNSVRLSRVIKICNLRNLVMKLNKLSMISNTNLKLLIRLILPVINQKQMLQELLKNKVTLLRVLIPFQKLLSNKLKLNSNNYNSNYLNNKQVKSPLDLPLFRLKRLNNLRRFPLLLLKLRKNLKRILLFM